jgi:hypothetical protein
MLNLPRREKGHKQRLTGIQSYEDLKDIPFWVPVANPAARDLSQLEQSS